MGRLGLMGFLTAFAALLYDGELRFPCPGFGQAITGSARPINQYSPVVIVSGLAAILFTIGYILFGIAMIRTVTLPRWSVCWSPWVLRPTYWVSG